MVELEAWVAARSRIRFSRKLAAVNADSDQNAVGLVVRGLEVLVAVQGEAVVFPRRADATVRGLADETGGWIEVGTLDGRRWLAAPAADGASPPAGLAFASARRLFDRVPLALMADDVRSRLSEDLPIAS